jgi:hypothetical protein
VAACDASEHVDETLQSLQFGLRAMSVRTQVRLPLGPQTLGRQGGWRVCPAALACAAARSACSSPHAVLTSHAEAVRHANRSLPLPNHVLTLPLPLALTPPPGSPAAPQAVVNERVDYCTLHAEMMAALETKDRKSSLLEASLLEKDAQLEAVQARLAVSGGAQGWGLAGLGRRGARLAVRLSASARRGSGEGASGASPATLQCAPSGTILAS